MTVVGFFGPRIKRGKAIQAPAYNRNIQANIEVSGSKMSRGKKGSKVLKVRFGTLTSQVDNAGDDNDRPSYKRHHGEHLGHTS